MGIYLSMKFSKHNKESAEMTESEFQLTCIYNTFTT